MQGRISRNVLTKPCKQGGTQIIELFFFPFIARSIVIVERCVSHILLPIRHRRHLPTQEYLLMIDPKEIELLNIIGKSRIVSWCRSC